MTGGVTEIIEIVGPPGSGKSSLVRSLMEKDADAVRVRVREDLSRADVLASALRAIPPFLGQASRMNGRRWYRFLSMVQLEAHRTAVARMRMRTGTLLLDQGPVYLSAIVERARNATGADARAFSRFLERTAQFWSEVLTAVVLLDAADDVLLERIRRRGTAHSLIDRGASDAARSLARTRKSLGAAARSLSSREGGPMLIELDSSAMAAGDLADVVRQRLSPTRARGAAR